MRQKADREEYELSPERLAIVKAAEAEVAAGLAFTPEQVRKFLRRKRGSGIARIPAESLGIEV